MPQCKSCGAQIKFIKLTTGKWNPCDPAKHSLILADDGEETVITDDGRIVRGNFASFEKGANATGYISHFATCPEAGKFRKNREGRNDQRRTGGVV